MRRLAWLTVMIVVVVGVVIAGCVAFAPGWIVRHDLGAGGAATLSAGDRLKAVNDVRATLLRHGGTYAMVQIADAAPHYRGHVAALLASFVRQQAPWPPTRPLMDVDLERERYHGGLRDDIGGAMAALSRRIMILPGTGIELEKVDLRGADLAGLDLSHFCFAGSNLDDAVLTGSDLSHTTLADTSLRNTDLTGARLTDADLTDADLTGAVGISTGRERAEPSETPT